MLITTIPRIPLHSSLYKHYKGGQYMIKHTKTEEVLVNKPRLQYARPLKMFNEYVVIDGKSQLRFEDIIHRSDYYVGEANDTVIPKLCLAISSFSKENEVIPCDSKLLAELVWVIPKLSLAISSFSKENEVIQYLTNICNFDFDGFIDIFPFNNTDNILDT